MIKRKQTTAHRVAPMLATLAMLLTTACRPEADPPEICGVSWNVPTDTPRVWIGTWNPYTTAIDWEPAPSLVCGSTSCTFVCGDATDVRVAWPACGNAWTDASDHEIVTPDCPQEPQE